MNLKLAYLESRCVIAIAVAALRFKDDVLTIYISQRRKKRRMAFSKGEVT